MSYSDQQREKKQNYLRNNILELGYDTQKFLDYISDCNPENGADIDAWDFYELKIIVKKFVELNPRDIDSQEQGDGDVQNENYEYQENNNNYNDNNNEDYQNNNSNIQEQYQDEEQQQQQYDNNNDVDYQQQQVQHQESKDSYNNYDDNNNAQDEQQQKQPTSTNEQHQQETCVPDHVHQQQISDQQQQQEITQKPEQQQQQQVNVILPNKTEEQPIKTPVPQQQKKINNIDNPFDNLIKPPQQIKKDTFVPKNDLPTAQPQTYQQNQNQNNNDGDDFWPKSTPDQQKQQQQNKNNTQKNWESVMSITNQPQQSQNTTDPNYLLKIQQSTNLNINNTNVNKKKNDDFDMDDWGDFEDTKQPNKQTQQTAIPSNTTQLQQQQQKQVVQQQKKNDEVDLFGDFDFLPQKPSLQQQQQNNINKGAVATGVAVGAGSIAMAKKNPQKSAFDDFDFDNLENNTPIQQQPKVDNKTSKINDITSKLKQNQVAAVSVIDQKKKDLEKKGQEIKAQIQEKKQEIVNQVNNKIQQQQSQLPQKGIQYQKDNIIYHKIHNCLSLGKTSLGNMQHVEIQIMDTQYVEGTFFNSSQYYYVIATNRMKWEVRRKFADFQWLWSMLQKQLPGSVIPPLHKKSTLTSNTSKQMVAKRQTFLEHFLNQCLRSEEIKNSQYLEAFLKVSDDKQFKQIQKESDKLPKIKSIGDIQTFSSKVESKITNDNQSFASSYEQYMGLQHLQYEKIKKLNKQMLNDYERLSNTIYEMGDSFANLHTNTQRFHDQIGFNQTLKVPQLEDTFKLMNNMFILQANQITNQVKQSDEHLQKFFKFQADNQETIKPLLITRNKYAVEFQRKKDMEQNIGRTTLSSNKIPILEPSKDAKVLQEQFGFYDYQLVKEGKRILEEKYQSYAKHFQIYVNLQKSVNLEMEIIWKDLGEKFKYQQDTSKTIQKLEIMQRKPGQNNSSSNIDSNSMNNKQ